MKIIEEKKEENPALNRKKITLKIKNYEETPSRQEVLEKISAKLNQEKENIVIDKIEQEYGKKEAKCIVKAYESPEDREKYSKKYKKERNHKEEEE